MIILALIVTFAIVLRLVGILWRPISNDEASHIYFGIQALRGSYVYDPEYHGPLEHYVIAFILLVFRKLIMSDPFVIVWSVRLAYAVFSIALIVVVYLFFRDYLGKLGTAIAAFLFAVSPEFLYYSRFAHEDIISVSLAVIAFIFFCKLYTSRSIKYVYGFLISLSLLFATKENWLLYLGIWSSYLIIVVLVEEFLLREKVDTLFSRLFRFIHDVFILEEFTEDGQRVCRLRKRELGHFLLALLIATLIAFALYSSFFTHPEKFITAIMGPFHWIERHHAPRIVGPFYYWFDRIWLYDLFLIPGVILAIKRNKDYLSELLLWWFVVSFIGYSYMQEKLPRLMMHITAPAVLLTSKYLNDLFTEFWKSVRGKSSKNLRIFVLTCVFITLLAISSYQSVLLNYINYDDVREPLIYARLTRGWQDVYRTIENIYSEKESVRILIIWDKGDYGLWPILFWLYYVEKDFRGVNVTYYKEYSTYALSSPQVHTYDVIICYFTKDPGSIKGFKLMGRYTVLKWVFHEKWSTQTTLEGFIKDFSHYLDLRFYFLRECDPKKITIWDYWAAVYVQEGDYEVRT